MSCLFCHSETAVEGHHVAAGVLELTVPLCGSCHRVLTARQHGDGVFRELKGRSGISEAWSFMAGFWGLLIELARASGTPDLVGLHERQQRAMLRLLSTLDGVAQIGPAPVKDTLRKRPQLAVSLTEDEAEHAARAVLDAVCDGAREWLGDCAPVGELAAYKDLPELLSDLTALADSLARGQLAEWEPELDLTVKLTERTDLQ
jgi:hypothetical protein